VDGASVTAYTANASGTITFVYSGGYSGHTFDLQTDSAPPSVAIVSPLNGAMVSSTVTLVASSTDNVAVANVTFYESALGGSLGQGTFIGSTSTPSGTFYSVPWNTGLVTNGSIVLWALATDTSNNTSTASTTVTVENDASSGGGASEVVTVIQGANGTISPGTQYVPSGAEETYAITPNFGYQIADVLVDGKSVGAITSYTLYVSTGHTITASFSSIPLVPVSSGGGSGTVAPSPVPSSTVIATSSPSVPIPSSTSSLQAELASLEAELQALMAQANQTTTVPSFVFTRNLQFGMTGNDVKQLQAFLIKENAGPAARALAKHGVTTNFASLTRAALIELQKSVGISPASGYFGPITRRWVGQR